MRQYNHTFATRVKVTITYTSRNVMTLFEACNSFTQILTKTIQRLFLQSERETVA